MSAGALKRQLVDRTKAVPRLFQPLGSFGMAASTVLHAMGSIEHVHMSHPTQFNKDQSPIIRHLTTVQTTSGIPGNICGLETRGLMRITCSPALPQCICLCSRTGLPCGCADALVCQ